MTREALASQLAEIVGSTHVSGVEADRRAFGDLDPELVVWPASAREVAQVLKACADANARVGVGGAQTRVRAWARAAEVALNTRRMADILEVDERSLTVHAQAGIRLRHLEQALSRQGLTLGYFRAGRQLGKTLGGALAAPLAMTHSPLYGRLVDNCIAVSVAGVDGQVLQSPVVPRSATGPDIKRLFIGAGGQLGVITAAVLRAHRLPEAELPVVQLYQDLGTALRAAARLLNRGVRPARLLVINEARAADEVGVRGYPMPALLIALLAGPEALVEAQADLLAEEVVALDGSELPQKLADFWWHKEVVVGNQLDEDDAPPAIAPPSRGFRMRHSQAPQVLAALERHLGSDGLRSVPIWIDNLTLHGGVLWVAEESAPPASDPTLAPLGVERRAAPLAHRLQAALDPDGVLVGRGGIT